MSEASRQELQRRYDERRARLPEWLREVDDYVTCRILNDEPYKGKDGEMWREHGGDMLRKIEQLQQHLANCRRALGELHIGVVALLLSEQDDRATIKMLSPAMTEALTKASNLAAATLAALPADMQEGA